VAEISETLPGGSRWTFSADDGSRDIPPQLWSISTEVFWGSIFQRLLAIKHPLFQDNLCHAILLTTPECKLLIAEDFLSTCKKPDASHVLNVKVGAQEQGRVAEQIFI